jgi:hypothetical protein
MAKPNYTLADVMLTLAAITYRGYDLVLPEPARRQRLREVMDALLQSLHPVRDQWDLVWGPASFNAGLTGFDDAAMYVAQKRQQPSQFVVAVRGTNPLSLFDWVFGDLLVTRQVPLAYGGSGDGAAISFSSALGLSILQHMRWEPEEAGTDFWQKVAATGQTLLTAAAAPLQPLTEALREPLRRLRNDLVDSARAASQLIPGLTDSSFAAWAATMEAHHSSPAALKALGAFDEALKNLKGVDLDPLRLVRGTTDVQQSFATGTSLQQFLAGVVAHTAAPVDVYVTGHSKGGALCTTLALWLADTQGRTQPRGAQWDPERKATVHAYAFAGPTPGNGAFARRVDAILKDRCHRIANHLDVVPHAWATDDLKKIPDLYDVPAAERAALAGLSTALIRVVGHLRYQHAGRDTTELPGQPLAGKPLVAQVVHQHLDGYFEQMDLSNDMSTATFFGPLS